MRLRCDSEVSSKWSQEQEKREQDGHDCLDFLVQEPLATTVTVDEVVVVMAGDDVVAVDCFVHLL